MMYVETSVQCTCCCVRVLCEPVGWIREGWRLEPAPEGWLVAMAGWLTDAGLRVTGSLW